MIEVVAHRHTQPQPQPVYNESGGVTRLPVSSPTCTASWLLLPCILTPACPRQLLAGDAHDLAEAVRIYRTAQAAASTTVMGPPVRSATTHTKAAKHCHCKINPVDAFGAGGVTCKGEYVGSGLQFSACRNFKLGHMPQTIDGNSSQQTMHAQSRAAARGPWNSCKFGASEQPCADCDAAIKAEALRNAAPKDPFANMKKREIEKLYKEAGGKRLSSTRDWPKVGVMKEYLLAKEKPNG